MLRLLAISAAIVLLGGCEKSSSRHRQIAAGSLSTCRLVEGGKVTCWGEGSVVAAQGSSTSGARTITSPNAVVDVNDATQIAVGLSSACAVRRNATAVCWGIDWSTATPGQNESLRRPAMVSDVAEVSAGRSHLCVLHRSGEVSCWGDNGSCQVGQPFRSIVDVVPKPVRVAGIEGVAHVTAGEQSTCVVHRDGKVSCWGTTEPTDAREQDRTGKPSAPRKVEL